MPHSSEQPWRSRAAVPRGDLPNKGPTKGRGASSLPCLPYPALTLTLPVFPARGSRGDRDALLAGRAPPHSCAFGLEYASLLSSGLEARLLAVRVRLLRRTFRHAGIGRPLEYFTREYDHTNSAHHLALGFASPADAERFKELVWPQLLARAK